MNKLIALALAGAVLVAGTAFAADPVVGTWKLDVAKSKFSPGPAPKSGTRVYTEANGVYTLNATTTGADGKESTLSVQYREGAENKMPTNAGGIDAITAQKKSDNDWSFQLKSGGKVVGHVHRVVSADGKTLSVHNTGKQPSGASGNDQMVFERQ